ncbi:MAG: hypothetical protein LBI02_11905, partial [Opitutaceae bacterium]|nr:hypothetical protein [Opitutaceae bacterium]
MPAFYSDNYKKMLAMYAKRNGGKNAFIKMKMKDIIALRNIIALRKQYVDIKKAGAGIANFYIWNAKLGKMLWVRVQNDDVEFLVSMQEFATATASVRQTERVRGGYSYEYESANKVERVSPVP